MKTESRNKRIELIQKIQELRKSKVFCYLTSDRPNATGNFAPDVLQIFNNQLKNQTGYKKIDILLFTLGGAVTAGFGLNKLFREYTSNINVLVPDKCFSAGTLFALGCNKILMTKSASLSPIDPSTNSPLNPAVSINRQTQVLPLNVEDLAGFKSFVKKEWKVDSKREISEILKLLSEKVHPLALGKTYRTRQQIELLATKLLNQHRNDRRIIKKIVDTLSKELGSHDYLIYRKEAKELLGNQVEINEKEEKLIWNLYDKFAEEMELGKEFNPTWLGNEGKNEFNLKIALVESEMKGNRYVQKGRLEQIPSQQPRARTFYTYMTKAGWEDYS